MKFKTYCYHITDGTRRAALQCGTVNAYSMEEAAETAAKLAGLEVAIDPDPETPPPWNRHWAKDGKRRNVYVLHHPTA